MENLNFFLKYDNDCLTVKPTDCCDVTVAENDVVIWLYYLSGYKFLPSC